MESGLQPGRIHALPVQVFYNLPNCPEVYTTTLPSFTDVFIHNPTRKRRKVDPPAGGKGKNAQQRKGSSVDPQSEAETMLVGSVSLRSVMKAVCMASPEINPLASNGPDSTIYIPVVQPTPSASTAALASATSQLHPQHPVPPGWPMQGYPGWPPYPGAPPHMAPNGQSGYPSTSPTPVEGQAMARGQSRPGNNGQPHQQLQQLSQPSQYPPGQPPNGYPGFPPPGAQSWGPYPGYPMPGYPGQVPPPMPAPASSPSSTAAPHEGKGLLSWVLQEPLPGNTVVKGKIVRSPAFKQVETMANSSRAGSVMNGDDDDGMMSGGLEALVQMAENKRKRKRAGGDGEWDSDDDEGEDGAQGRWGLEIVVILKAMPGGSGGVKQEPGVVGLGLSNRDGSMQPYSRAGSVGMRLKSEERRPSLPAIGRQPSLRPLQGLPHGGSDPITAADMAHHRPPPQQRPLQPAPPGPRGPQVTASRKLSSQLSMAANNESGPKRKEKSPPAPVIVLDHPTTPPGMLGKDLSSRLADAANGGGGNGARNGPLQQQPGRNGLPQGKVPPKGKQRPSTGNQNQNSVPPPQPQQPSQASKQTPTESSADARPDSHTTPGTTTSHLPAHLLRTPQSTGNGALQPRSSPATNLALARSILKNPSILTIELAQKLVSKEDFSMILNEIGVKMPDMDGPAGSAGPGPSGGKGKGRDSVGQGQDVDGNKAEGSASKGKKKAEPPKPATAVGGKAGAPVYTCGNCGTHETPTWRVKQLPGGRERRVCDACGIYFNKTKTMRPKELWGTDPKEIAAAAAAASASTVSPAQSEQALPKSQAEGGLRSALTIKPSASESGPELLSAGLPGEPPRSPSRKGRPSAADAAAFQTPRRSSRLNTGFTPAKPASTKSGGGSGQPQPEEPNSPRRMRNTPRRLGRTKSAQDDLSTASTSKAQKQMMSLSVDDGTHSAPGSRAGSQGPQLNQQNEQQQQQQSQPQEPTGHEDWSEQFRLMVESANAVDNRAGSSDQTITSSATAISDALLHHNKNHQGPHDEMAVSHELEELLKAMEEGQAERPIEQPSGDNEPKFSQKELELLLALTAPGGVEGANFFDFAGLAAAGGSAEALPNRQVDRVVNGLGEWEGSSPWEIDTPSGGLNQFKAQSAPMLGAAPPPPHQLQNDLFPDMNGPEGEIGLAELEQFV